MMECARCHRHPSEISEYVDIVKSEDLPLRVQPDKDGSEITDPAMILHLMVEDYIVSDEGTYDPSSGFFLCTHCYIAVGMPSSRQGWRATPDNLIRLALED